jgi:chemotaxis family two-component system response regulator Rcp1
VSGVARGKQMEILLVEDNPGAVRLLVEVLKKAHVPYRLSAVGDGVEALAFLRREAPHAAAPRPDLILLDLNQPKKDGRQALAEIKADPGLKRIPIVILTSSKAEQDILQAYDNHANCYVVKPIALHEFISAVKSIEAFWLTYVELPAR